VKLALALAISLAACRSFGKTSDDGICLETEPACDQVEARAPGACCGAVYARRILPDGGGFWPDAASGETP
jgi:hypothetical protein